MNYVVPCPVDRSIIQLLLLKSRERSREGCGKTVRAKVTWKFAGMVSLKYDKEVKPMIPQVMAVYSTNRQTWKGKIPWYPLDKELQATDC